MKGYKFTFVALLALVGAFSCVSARAEAVEKRNKVVMVDEEGNNNAPEVLADLAAQAQNEAKVLVAAAAAEAAQKATDEATAIVGDVVASITRNEVRVFRKGYMSSFAPLIVFTDDDTLAICEFTMNRASNTATIGYVSTVNWGALKPQVKAADSLSSPRADWDVMADTAVSAVTIHNETRTEGGVTYSVWYSVDVQLVNDNQHFFAIEMNPDTPSGDGLTLDVKNGFTGGFTGELTESGMVKTFKGGLLMSVRPE